MSSFEVGTELVIQSRLGDIVHHFSFGERVVVISSYGETLHLRSIESGLLQAVSRIDVVPYNITSNAQAACLLTKEG